MKRVPSQSSVSSSVTSLSGAILQAPQPYHSGAPSLPTQPNDTVVGGGNMSFNPYNVKPSAPTLANNNESNDTKISNNEAFLAFL